MFSLQKVMEDACEQYNISTEQIFQNNAMIVIAEGWREHKPWIYTSAVC